MVSERAAEEQALKVAQLMKIGLSSRFSSITSIIEPLKTFFYEEQHSKKKDFNVDEITAVVVCTIMHLF